MKNKILKNQLTRGTTWLVLSNIFSRIIGIIYVIPWTIFFGVVSVNANALFGKGYTIYQFFLVLSTVGLPSAVTQMSNILSHQKRTSFLISSTKFSIIQGLLAGTAFWLLSPILSNGDTNLIPVIHSLSATVIIFPLLSVIRGYFQSRLEMDVIAKSEIIEQIVRVLYMLISAYLILKVFKGNWVVAVVHSTFAAAVGASVSLIYLAIKLFSIINIHDLRQKYKESQPFNILIIIKRSLPFVFIGSFLSIYQLIDQYTFFPLMHWIRPEFSTETLNVIFGVFNFNVNKLILIIVSLATSIASTILPVITNNLTDIEIISTKVKQSAILFLAIVLPAALGLYALSNTIYIVFYGSYVNADLTSAMTRISAITSIFMGAVMLLSMIMQSLLKTQLIIYHLAIGCVVKILIQPLLIYIVGEFGPIYSTLISLCIVFYLMLRYLNVRTNVINVIYEKTFIKIIGTSSIMFIVALTINNILQSLFNTTSRLTQSYFLFIEVSIGIIIVIISYIKFGIFKKLAK